MYSPLVEQVAKAECALALAAWYDPMGRNNPSCVRPTVLKHLKLPSFLSKQSPNNFELRAAFFLIQAKAVNSLLLS